MVVCVGCVAVRVVVCGGVWWCAWRCVWWWCVVVVCVVVAWWSMVVVCGGVW